MSTYEADRRLIHNKLVEIAGPREADLMMEMFSNQDLTAQIASLRAELHIEIVGVRADTIDRLASIRTDMATGFANVETEFAKTRTTLAEAMARNERAMRFQLIWLVATMIAMSSIAIAILH